MNKDRANAAEGRAFILREKVIHRDKCVCGDRELNT